MSRKALLFLLFLLAGLLLLAIAARPGAAGDFEGAQYDRLVVRAYFTDRQMVADLAAWKEPWEINYEDGYLVVDVDGLEYEMLAAAGFVLETDTRLTAELYRPRQPLEGQISGIPGFPCYRTVEETFASAAGIVAGYPSLATWTDIGDSWEKVTAGGNPGYDMMVLRLTNSAVPGPKPVFFVNAAIHAREYTTAELMTRFAEYLVNNYDSDPDVTWLLDYHEVHLLLHTNPDGRKMAETGLLWRKNTNNNYCSNTNTRGADLNRNFEFQWGCCGGSSGSQCSETYRGASPASEPEVQAVQNYLRAVFPDQRGPGLGDPAPADATGVYLDVHSYSELVLWPWGFTTTPAPNGPALQTFGRRLAYFNGYFPEQAIGLYPTDGTTDDFGYGDLGVASYTFELGTAFFQACSTFESAILPDNLAALLYMAKNARTPYLTPSGPEALSPALDNAAVPMGTPVQLSATLDDTRVSNANGTEPTQNISAGEYYVDTPPWAGGAALPMTAADGAFDQKVEGVQATVNTTGLSSGRHTLFVRGQDAAASWGPVSAVFLYIIDPAVAPTVEGYITDASTGDPVQADIAIGPHFQTVSDPGTGFYQTQVVSGTYDITASAADYAAETVTGVVLHDFQTVQQDFQLEPVCAAFEDDVEAGNIGWTAQTPWAITAESAHSPANSWTDSPGGNYGNNRNTSLTSPVFDLSGYTNISLNFWQICDTEAGYDYCRVEVSDDGGTNWTSLATYDGSSSAWEEVTLAAPQLDGQPDARIRFRFTSDTNVVDDGWHVDDVRVLGSGGSCGAPLLEVRSAGIKMTYQPGQLVRARIVAFDQDDARVPGAIVDGQWTLPGGGMLPASKTTNANGIAVFNTPYAGPGTYTFTILNITKAGYTFVGGVTTKSIVAP